MNLTFTTCLKVYPSFNLELFVCTVTILNMCDFRKGPSIPVLTKLIVFLVLTCDARTINDCGDFVAVKVWKYRRQLLIRKSNVWLREVVAWESQHSYAYILREVTNGEQSYQAIFDENMDLRNCQVTEGYTEDGNSALISDLKHECNQASATYLDIESEPGALELLLQTRAHTPETFKNLVKALDRDKIEVIKKDFPVNPEVYNSNNKLWEDDRLHNDEKLSEPADLGPSVLYYRRLAESVPAIIDFYLDFENNIKKCNDLNKEVLSRYGSVEMNEDPGMLAPWLPKFMRDFPSTLRKHMEAVGLVDELEEAEDDEDDEYDETFQRENSVQDEGEDFHERQKRGLFMFPGTLWCGTGNRAPTYDSLGMYNKTDMCCREHDHSTDAMSIGSRETKYHLTNWAMFTVTHCSLDKKFHKCLRQVKNMAAYEVGRGYFNIFNVQCFVIRKRKQCVEKYWYMPWRCKRHEYLDTACLRKAQIFPSQKYVWPF